LGGNFSSYLYQSPLVKYEADDERIPEAIEVFDGNGGESAIDPYHEAVGDERIYMLIDL